MVSCVASPSLSTGILCQVYDSLLAFWIDLNARFVRVFGFFLRSQLPWPSSFTFLPRIVNWRCFYQSPSYIIDGFTNAYTSLIDSGPLKLYHHHVGFLNLILAVENSTQEIQGKLLAVLIYKYVPRCTYGDQCDKLLSLQVSNFEIFMLI